MHPTDRRYPASLIPPLLFLCALLVPAARSAPAQAEGGQALLAHLDAPLLFVKRHNYKGIHIYDTFYKWGPGGGIYILESPAAPRKEHRVRPLIDPTTPGTLGAGVYSDPELSWDARRLLFCFKPEAKASTSIYEINTDGTGLRRVSDPTPHCAIYKGSHAGQHDVSPVYLPDGRILFTSTRKSGLVPCANEGVDILHVMSADGTNVHTISVNNVNEFDPAVLHDGRILFGRWEYVDKTALTQQSLWTVFPDGTQETALYANNMVFPTAVLDARPVPGSNHLIAAALTRHNSPPRGSVAFIDPRLGKNDPDAITNLEHPEEPTFDRGDSCEPWPLSDDVMLYSGKPAGAAFNAVMMIDRTGRRVTVYSDPAIDCHSPMLIKPRRPPHVSPALTAASRRTGRFFIQDVRQGLDGVAPGEVKWLRVIEETSRVSATPGGAYNQTFLVSAALAFSVKNVLGVVPVEADGSAYFEVPAGRAIYLQALDDDGLLVRSMRTFVQAAPGTTRSCIGCHETKFAAPGHRTIRVGLERRPKIPRPESWGSGYVDYPGMVQPILDRRCVRCHGGEDGIAAGLDLSSGWTEHFNISYENLVTRRRSQVTADLIAGIDCMNGTATWSARILPPRAHGSGAAPLARIVVSGHKERIGGLTRPERDLLLAWIDTNGLYHGTWDYTAHGCRLKAWDTIKAELVTAMDAAGCMPCHGKNGKLVLFENDWINLQRPELSRILRAPLPKGADGHGLGLCRDRKVDPARQRLRLLALGRYMHGVLPLEKFRVPERPPDDMTAAVVTPLASPSTPHYRAILDIVRRGRRRALAAPRVDMPGAEVIPGACRHTVPTPLPGPLPELQAITDREGAVHLAWERSARTIGLASEVHRGERADFAPDVETLLRATTLFGHADLEAEPGPQHYALVLVSDGQRSPPIRARVDVPAPTPPEAPESLHATPAPGRVELGWGEVPGLQTRYNVYRSATAEEQPALITAEPVSELVFADVGTAEDVRYSYTVRAVNRRGLESRPSNPVSATALPEPKAPVFDVAFSGGADARLPEDATHKGKLHGKARASGGSLDLREGGHVTFGHLPAFDLSRRLSVECWVRIEKETQMPVIASCGVWRQGGWFLQRIGAGWRWHVGGVSCDGGKPAPGRMTHLVGTFDGQKLQLYQDGEKVAETTGAFIREPWPGALHVGQYSGGVGPQYQVLGQLGGFRIYNRALPDADVRSAFDTAAAKQLRAERSATRPAE